VLHVISGEDPGLEGVEGGPFEPAVLALLNDDVELTFLKPKLVGFERLVVVESSIDLINIYNLVLYTN